VTTAELNWTADHGFQGTFAPGSTTGHWDMPPLFDQYFDPFWRTCQERGLAIAIHAAHGMEQGAFLGAIDKIIETMRAAGRDDLLAEIVSNTENSFFALDLRPRRAMWQMMLGGVFDRFPDLRLMMTEVRADWLPATLRHLDAAYERVGAPAKYKPSVYWKSNCLAGVSSVHKAEVEMRDEIGVETMMFGRDYPHSEGTWPNTADWLTDAFAGVPDDEIRLMLGENAVSFLGLDRAHLAAIAERIGPTIADITGRQPAAIDERRIAHFDRRAAYLRPAEQIKTDAIDALLDDDLARAHS
jgi:predicted TIM-barrel fold metal-dependent hydrolase